MIWKRNFSMKTFLIALVAVIMLLPATIVSAHADEGAQGDAQIIAKVADVPTSNNTTKIADAESNDEEDSGRVSAESNSESNSSSESDADSSSNTEETKKKSKNKSDEDSEQAFTISGNAGLQDEIKSSGKKDFYTIQTKNNQTYYLVVDHSGSEENVYLLSQIDENDLEDFLKNADTGSLSGNNSVVVVPEETQTPAVEEQTEVSADEPEEEQKQEEQKGSGLMSLIILAIVGAGGAFYYFKVYKPRKEQPVWEPEGMEEDDGLPMENEDEEDEEV